MKENKQIKIIDKEQKKQKKKINWKHKRTLKILFFFTALNKKIKKKKICIVVS